MLCYIAVLADRERMILLIAIPTGVVVFIAIVSTIFALCAVSHQKKREQHQRQSHRGSRDDVQSAVTTFTTSTTVS